MGNYHCSTAVKRKEWHRVDGLSFHTLNTHNILCVAPDIEKKKLVNTMLKVIISIIHTFRCFTTTQLSICKSG